MSNDLHDVLEALIEGVVVLGANAEIRTANAQACRILECSIENAVGLRIEEALGEGHPVVDRIRSTLSSGRATVDNEVDFLNRASGPLIVDIAVAVLPGDPHSSHHAVLTLRDRTLPTQLQRAASQRDLLAAFGRIAAGIAHEVKNPLGGIRGAAELLEQWSVETRACDAAGMIVREVDRISALVDDLMVFARADALRTERINIHKILDSVLELLALDSLAKAVVIDRLYDPSIPEIIADPDRLKQVFLNLAKNSLQAMQDQGGRLKITTQMTTSRRVGSRSLQPQTGVAIIIGDNGCGIDPETMERLATPLFTTRAEGHGLGLATARHWLMQHGGTLSLKSAPQEGTEAEVTLPLQQSKPSATPTID
jgi:two-component system nitrogen regulation sensor histidine kinase GlnL